MAGPIDRTDIERVYSIIQPYIRKTPVVDVAGADFGLTQSRLVIKLELLQRAGSFKTRGAFANLLTRPVPPAGVVAASGGVDRRWLEAALNDNPAGNQDERTPVVIVRRT